MISATSPAPPLSAGSILSGRFRLVRRIGEGGIGLVFEAEHLLTRVRGALKLLRPSPPPPPEAVERLLREASAAGRIDHPHIVQTLDAGRLDAGEPYVFMELLRGQSLYAAIQRRRLPCEEVVELTLQTAEALVAAHAANILHRDIKPGNLFLLEGPEIFIKILDFGVSKFGDVELKTLTKEGRPLGTYCYMPPEQMMEAKRVDARADVYALAVVLYECLVGAPPFVAKNLAELGQQMRDNDYLPLREVRNDTPRELDALLARALRAEPGERHPSMREFHADLAEVAAKLGMQRPTSLSASRPTRGRSRGKDPESGWAKTQYGEPSPLATVPPKTSRRRKPKA